MTYKRRIGKRIDWGYSIELPGSTKKNRKRILKTGFKTQKAAQDAEAIRRVDLKSELEATAKAPAVRTLRTLLAEFFADFHGAPKTLERYRELAEYLHADLQAKPVTEITALDLHKEWKRLAECGGHTRKDKTPRPLSPKTVRNICGVVSSAYSYALLYELVSQNPAKASQPPKLTKPEKLALSPDQEKLIRDSATVSWLPAFVELASATGCRRGELLALEWSDFDGAKIWVNHSLSQTRAGLETKSTKTGAPRDIVLPDSAVAALKAHRERQAENREHFGSDYQGNLIFANPDGSALKPDSVSSAVSALCKRLKLPKGISLHSLRHSHGSQLIAQGVPVTEVARRLGHSTPQTTMQVYAHALPNRDEEAARKWEELRNHQPITETRQ